MTQNEANGCISNSCQVVGDAVAAIDVFSDVASNIDELVRAQSTDALRQVEEKIKAQTRDAVRHVEEKIQAQKQDAIRLAEDMVRAQIAHITVDALTAQIPILAEQFSNLRKLSNLHTLPSNQEECDCDWYLAKGVLMLALIDNKGFDVTCAGSSLYPLVDGLWMDCLHQIKAYYIWQTRRDQPAQQNYFDACAMIRTRLCQTQTNNQQRFLSVSEYLEQNVLGSTGKLDDSKKVAQDLITAKAFRLWKLTGVAEKERNWNLARLYTKMFYENIIPAVAQNDREATIKVFHALQFTKSPKNRYFIIHAFEGIIALQFLNKLPVVDLAAASSPDQCSFSLVPVEDWPSACFLPFSTDPHQTRFRYDRSCRHIIFRGVMSLDEKQNLVGLLNDRRHIAALEELYEQSRMGPLQDMIL